MTALGRVLGRWVRARGRAPLAAWRAWEHPEGRGQGEVVREVARHREVLALGGNRSGKTEAMRAILVALALGSDHPHARLFWEHHGVDPEAFPRGPGTVWLIALSSSDSINYHRRWVERLLPAGSYTWWNRNSLGEARVEIVVEGYDTPAEIVFKSDDQGVEAMQGASVRAIGHDEEGADPKVYDECGVRLWDQDGWHLMANTPINGQTWVYHRFVRNGAPEGAAVRYLWTIDNPFIPKSRAARMERDNPSLAAARLRGEFVVLKDRIWPGFSRSTHVIAPFAIPRDWPRFRAIDFGTQAPFACVWTTRAKRDHQIGDRTIPEGSLIAYREHYQRQWTIARHVVAIREAEGWWRDPAGVLRPPEADRREVIEGTWVDPEDPQARLSLNSEHDMDCTPGNNALLPGIEAVGALIEAGRLFVFDTCPNTIREVEGWIWTGDPETGQAFDVPAKKDDHTCDCLRYTAMGVGQW